MLGKDIFLTVPSDYNFKYNYIIKHKWEKTKDDKIHKSINRFWF